MRFAGKVFSKPPISVPYAFDTVARIHPFFGGETMRGRFTGFFVVLAAALLFLGCPKKEGAGGKEGEGAKTGDKELVLYAAGNSICTCRVSPARLPLT